MSADPPLEQHAWRHRLAAALIVAAGIVAYADGLSGGFIFDDLASIVDNPSIRDLTRVGALLTPPGEGRTVQGRPVVNVTLAIDYAVHGFSVEGYHEGSLLVHLVCALLLFGVVRRTLLVAGGASDLAARSTSLAFAAALLWVVPPLATEPVVYVVQRCEALMATFYLLTFYCLVRGVQSGRRGQWGCAAVAACVLGMASKEVMVSAPLLALLYDRLFLSGSFRRTLRERGWVYLGFASTWALLVFLMVRSGTRGGTVDYIPGTAWWDYAQTQVVAIATYLKLCVLPAPLIYDYGAEPDTNPGHVWPCAVVVAIVISITIVQLRRRPRLGFLLVAFFVILSPTTSFVPVLTQSIAEHRMYLPLAAMMTLAVVVAWRLGGHLPAATGWGALAAAAVVLAFVTRARTQDFKTGVTIWTDTVAKRPQNPRAHNDLGTALMELGKPKEALPHYMEAVRLDPRLAEAQNSIGGCFNMLGRPAEALPHLKEALRLAPRDAVAHDNMGGSLSDLGRNDDAIAEYEEAIRLKPEFAKAHMNLGITLDAAGRHDDAVAQLREAVRLKPDYGIAHYNLGIALIVSGDPEGALAEIREAARLLPRHQGIRRKLEQMERQRQ